MIDESARSKSFLLINETEDADGRVAKRYTVGFFTGIEVNGPADMTFHPGESYEFAIVAADSDHEHIQIRWVGDDIRFDWDDGFLNRRHPSKPLSFQLSGPTVDEIRIGDDVNAVIDSLAVERFKLLVGKNSTASLGALQVKSLKSHLDQNASANLSGSVENLQVSVKDKGSYDASALKADEVEADAHDGAVITVRVAHKLDAKARKLGRVVYIGNPTSVKIDVEDGGTVSKG